VLACPFASVVAVTGDTVALPLVTVNVTDAPTTPAWFLRTKTEMGANSTVPGNPVCPFPDAILTEVNGVSGVIVPVPVDPAGAVSLFPQAAVMTASEKNNAPRMRGASMRPPDVDRATRD
jgi:hypothetical protein